MMVVLDHMMKQQGFLRGSEVKRIVGSPIHMRRLKIDHNKPMRVSKPHVQLRGPFKPSDMRRTFSRSLQRRIN